MTATSTLMLAEMMKRPGSSCVRSWKKGGYSDFVVTGNGTTALDLIANGPIRIDLLITDVAHPGMDGFALTRAVREIDPDIKVLVVSGQAVDETVTRRLDDDSIPFSGKTLPYEGFARHGGQDARGTSPR